MLVLETLARRAASPGAVQALMRYADALVEGARSGGRLGYKRAAEAALAFPLSFRAAYVLLPAFRNPHLSRRPPWRKIRDPPGDARADSGTRRGQGQAARSIFERGVSALIDRILEGRLSQTQSALGTLRRQYVDYAAALEARFLRQSGLRSEIGRYRELFESGLIPTEVYRDLAEQRRRSPARRTSAPFRYRPRYSRSGRAARTLRRSRQRATRQHAEAAAADLHRPERVDRAQGRTRRLHVLHRFGRGRGRLSRPHAFR